MSPEQPLRFDEAKFDLGSYLENYEEDLAHPPEEDQLRATLEADFENLQNNIAAYGFPPLGRFFTNKNEDIRQSFASLHAMLKQRAKDLEFRSEIYQKAESDRKMSDLNLERLRERHDALQQELAAAKTQFKAQEGRWKGERERLTAERDELNKVAVRLQQKESQFAHEMRKKQQIYTKLQDQIRKNAFEKNPSQPAANGIEMTAPLLQHGPQLFHRGSDTEFTNLVTRGYEELQNKLIAENTDLRQCLKLLQQEMLDIVAFKREAHKRRYGEASEELETGGLAAVPEARLRQPFAEAGEDVIRLYQDNMRRLREFLDRCGMRERAAELEESEGGSGEAGSSAFGKLQSLMKQYRALADAQESLLFKSIVKQSQVKPPEEVSQTNSRFRTVTEGEIEEYKRFLTEQKMLLQRNQQDLENEKNMLSATAKSLDAEKLKIAQQRQKLQAEKERLKENIALAKNE